MKYTPLTWIKTILPSLILTLVSVTFTVAIAEICLRFLFPAGYLIWEPHLNRTFLPAQGVMPGISGESRFQTNSRGLRADELGATDAYRVLTIGGSTTECLYLDQSETWPQVLQDTLNKNGRTPRVWVGNAGMSGRNSRHHVMAMRYLPLDEMKIDAVVVLAGINDLSLRLSQGDEYDSAASQSPEMQSRLIEETFRGMQYGNPHDPWIKRTFLWQQLRRLKTKLTAKGDAGRVQDQAGDVYVTWRKHRLEATDIRNALPDLTSAIDEYIGNIRELAKLSRARSVRLIVMTQPTMWKPGLSQDLESLLWLGGVGDFQTRSSQPYYSVEALSEAITRYNDALLNLCSAERLECIDLSGLEKDTSVFYDDVHFNEVGAGKVASILSNYLQSIPLDIPIIQSSLKIGSLEKKISKQ